LTIAPERLIFLDESGVMVGMTRRRGDAWAGVVFTKPRQKATGES